MINKSVKKTDNGVAIDFSGAIAKETVFTMVQNCANGRCECMSEETKAKIGSMKVEGVDGDVSLKLEGDVSTEEIEAALERSKVLK